MALREKGDFAAALPHLRRTVEADPGNASLHYELGQALRQSGELGGAVAAFERALEINPELREAYYALGAALKQQSATARKPAPPAPSAADDAVAAREVGGRAPRFQHGGNRVGRGPPARRQSCRGPHAAGLRPRPAGQPDGRVAALAAGHGAASGVARGPTTTSARPCGTAARESRRSPSCARACGSIPGLPAGTRSSAWRSGKPAISPVPAPVCSARWRWRRRWRPPTSISRSSSSAPGIWSRGSASSKPA